MKIDVIEKKKNPILKREEMRVKINHQGKPTPTRGEILDDVATKLAAKKDLIIIDKIFSGFGKAESEAKVFLYSKGEDIPKDKAEKMGKKLAKSQKTAKGDEAIGQEAPEEPKKE